MIMLFNLHATGRHSYYVLKTVVRLTDKPIYGHDHLRIFINISCFIFRINVTVRTLIMRLEPVVRVWWLTVPVAALVRSSAIRT